MAGSITAYETKAGTRYRVRYRKPDGAQTDRRGFTTKRDAKIFLSTVDVSKLEGSYVDPTKGRATVAELGEKWLTWQSHLKPSTLHSLKSTWKTHVKPAWGDRSVATIMHSEIQDWITLLHEGVEDKDPKKAIKGKSATTVKRAHGILNAILNRAALDKRIPANPASGIGLPRKTPKARAYLTHKQVTLLAKESKDHETLVLFLAYTGLRWGEATGLTVANLDFIRKRAAVESNAVMVNGHVKVGTPKTHRKRWVPFPEFLRAPLTAAIEGKAREQLVFGDGDHHVLLPNSTRGWFHYAVKRSQAKDKSFPRVTPHDLRHTTASLAIASGANVKAVQRMLGHASAAMTLDTYADLFDDDLETVATALETARKTYG